MVVRRSGNLHQAGADREIQLEACSDFCGRLQSRQVIVDECRVHQNESAERGGPSSGAILGADRPEGSTAGSPQGVACAAGALGQGAHKNARGNGRLGEAVFWRSRDVRRGSGKKISDPGGCPCFEKANRPYRVSSRIFKTGIGRVFQNPRGRGGIENGAARSARPSCVDGSYCESRTLRSDGNPRPRTNPAETSTRDRAG